MVCSCGEGGVICQLCIFYFGKRKEIKKVKIYTRIVFRLTVYIDVKSIMIEAFSLVDLSVPKEEVIL